MRILILLGTLVAIVARCSGQGTVHIRFDDLPEFTSLNDQFASQGIIFMNEWRYTSPLVVKGSSINRSLPSSNVAMFSDNSRALGIFSKNAAIASVSMDFALSDGGRSGGNMRLSAYGLDDYPATTGVWGAEFSPRMQNYAWSRQSFTAPEGLSSKLWEFNGENVLNTLNFGAYIYVGAMDITFVPEPSAEALMSVAGIATLLLFRKKLPSKAV